MDLYFKARSKWSYWNGNYQHFLETQSTITSTTGSQVFVVNVLYAFPIIVKEDVTISEISIAYTSAVAGNSVYGLYDMLNGLPNNLIFQSAPFDNAVTGAQINILATPQIIKKGIYFVVYNTSSAPNVYTFNRLSIPNVFGTTFATNFGGVNVIRLTAAYNYTGTLPATFGSPVLNTLIQSIPTVLFKIA